MLVLQSIGLGVCDPTPSPATSKHLSLWLAHEGTRAGEQDTIVHRESRHTKNRTRMGVTLWPTPAKPKPSCLIYMSRYTKHIQPFMLVSSPYDYI